MCFKNYIGYNTAKTMIFYELIDKQLIYQVSQHIISVSEYQSLINNEEYHMNILHSQYSDTYDFLVALRNNAINID